MMERWMPLALFGLFMAILMIFLTRYQAARYQGYLNQHNETTKAMADEQKRTQAAIDRQTAALERIAIALENRA
jgi:cell division protein FtsW (lipid II flippase)